MHWGGGLRVFQFFKGDDHWNCLLRREVPRADFTLCCGTDNDVDDLAQGVYGSIEWRDANRRFGWIKRARAEKEMPCGSTACFALGQVRAIGMCVQYHVAGVILDDGERIAVCKIHEPRHFLFGVLGGICL